LAILMLSSSILSKSVVVEIGRCVVVDRPQARREQMFSTVPRRMFSVLYPAALMVNV
jgi:hypothetical protein